MKEQVVTYFVGEKQGALILLVVGTIALASALALVATRSSHRGMAVPLVLFALFELGIAGVLLARTEGQVAALLDHLARAPAVMAHDELARMGPVMRNFAIVIVVELVVLAGGVVLALAFRSDFAFAAGVGCIAQASFLLVFDLFAQRRGQQYVDVLRQMVI